MEDTDLARIVIYLDPSLILYTRYIANEIYTVNAMKLTERLIVGFLLSLIAYKPDKIVSDLCMFETTQEKIMKIKT